MKLFTIIRGSTMKLNFEEKCLFASQMAMILNAGFDMQQGVEMIQQESENSHLKEVLKEVIENFKEDSRLSQAVMKTEAFDGYMVHLLEVGEMSGHLDDVMLSLANYYGRMRDMSDQLQQALTYPIVLLMMMFVVIGVIVFKVLPIFQNVLKSLGSHLSPYAYTFMKVGQIASVIGFVVLTVVLIGVLAFYIYSKMTRTNLLTVFIYKTPFMRSLSYALSHAQMTYALSMFMSSGYEFEEAVENAIPLVEEKALKVNLQKAYQDMRAGDMFIDSVSKHRIYQGMKLNMLQVGVKTGQVEQVLKQLSATYQDEVSESITRFLNIIEPAIITFLSVIVGMILLSVMLPIVSVLSSL